MYIYYAHRSPTICRLCINKINRFVCVAVGLLQFTCQWTFCIQLVSTDNPILTLTKYPPENLSISLNESIRLITTVYCIQSPICVVRYVVEAHNYIVVQLELMIDD